jgi:Recombinase/Resolvase, N terminal domain
VSKGALGVFLDLVRDHKIERGSVLLIEHLDRFTRQDAFSGMELINEIIKCGIDIVTLMDGERYSRERLTSDFALSMKLQFSLFQNHQESDKKSKRLKDVWSAKRTDVRAGKTVVKRVPLWIDQMTGHVIEEKADMVRRVFKLALDGHGYHNIAKQFNIEGTLPPGGRGRWSGTLVKYYLTNRIVLGEYQPCRSVEGRDVPEGDSVPGYYPAIVDRTTFFKVQNQLNSRKRTVKGRDSGSANARA